MAGKRSKIHHFVPQGLQRYFLDENGQIWFAERDEKGQFSEIEARNTGSTFKQRDYYTVYEDGKLSDRIEKDVYGAIDDFLRKFLDEVHSAMDEGKKPKVVGDSLKSIRRAVYHLVVRTPEFASRYDDYEIGREFYKDVLEHANEKGLSEDQILTIQNELADESFVRRQGRTIRVKAQAGPTKLIEKALEKMTVRFARISGKHSFVLTSQAAYRIGNGGSNGLKNPDAEVWLPISPKRALVMLQDPTNKIPPVIDEPRDHVRSINEFAVRNANQVASHSKQLLASLIARKNAP